VLYNLVDGRERRFRWQKIKAIIEPTCHDNPVKDSDQVPPPPRSSMLVSEIKNGISLNEAVKWAEEQTVPVTLFLYDYIANEEE